MGFKVRGSVLHIVSGAVYCGCQLVRIWDRMAGYRWDRIFNRTRKTSYYWRNALCCPPLIKTRNRRKLTLGNLIVRDIPTHPILASSFHGSIATVSLAQSCLSPTNPFICLSLENITTSSVLRVFRPCPFYQALSGFQNRRLSIPPPCGPSIELQVLLYICEA